MLKFRKGLEIKEVDEKGTVLANIATLNIIDKDGDVILPGFFGEQEVTMLPVHDWQSIPLGKGTLREVGSKAVTSIQMNLGIQKAKDWHSALKFDLAHGKPLQEWSFGFRVRKGGSKEGEFEGRPVRFLGPLLDGSPGAKVDEVSPVLVGAGEDTGTISVKGAEGKTFLDQAAVALASVKELVCRAKSLAELRGKDGRILSKSNLEILEGLHGEVELLKESLAVLSTQKKTKEDENIEEEIAAAIAETEALGFVL